MTDSLGNETMKRCTEGNRLIRRKAQKGVILVPCLLLLSLISLISLGYLKTTGTEIKTSEVLDKKYKAKLAAESARVLALSKLGADLNYTGDANLTLPGSNDTLDITVTAPSSQERELTVTGYCGSSKAAIQETLSLQPSHFDYALVSYGKLNQKKDALILGDIFIADEFKGESTAKVVGNIHLCGPRTLLSDIDSKIIKIEGNDVPTITGEVVTDLAPIYPPRIYFPDLHALALSDGMVINTNRTLENVDLHGVIFIQGGCDVEFRNVTIHGVLVVRPIKTLPPALFSGSISLLGGDVIVEGFSEKFDGAGDPESELRVKDGYFLKIIPDPNIREDIAILAPSANLKVEGKAYLDVVGTVMVGYGEFKSDNHTVITGTTIVYGSIECDGGTLFQSPSSTRDSILTPVEFRDMAITESSYTDK